MAIDGNIVGFTVFSVIFCIFCISWSRCSDREDDYDDGSLLTPLPACVTEPPPVALPACVTEPPPVALATCVTEAPLSDNVHEAPPCYRDACRCPSYV
jgi:hypothetical protein